MKKSFIKKVLFILGILIFITITLFFWFYYPALKPVNSETKATIKGGGLPPGCVCHSKNPSYVSMHKLFSVEDCRKCHQKKENLMKKKSASITAERKKVLQKKISKEPICQNCHQENKIVKLEKTEISGGWFCPKEQKTYKKNQTTEKNGKYYCPKDGSELIDVDAITLKSAKEPKNEYCILCHPVDNNLKKKHQKLINTSGILSIDDCLKCHKSHSQCGSCHF